MKTIDICFSWCEGSFEPWWYHAWLLSNESITFKDCYSTCESKVSSKGELFFLFLFHAWMATDFYKDFPICTQIATVYLDSSEHYQLL